MKATSERELMNVKKGNNIDNNTIVTRAIKLDGEHQNGGIDSKNDTVCIRDTVKKNPEQKQSGKSIGRKDICTREYFIVYFFS